MRILIVEDDTTSRLVLEKSLSRVGEITSAVDGEDGIQAFEAALSAGQAFDLVCLDIMMPKYDGQTVLERIRGLETAKGLAQGKRAKVIMTTALDDKENLMKALPRCDAYLTKPIDLAALMFYIKKFGLVESGRESSPGDASKSDKHVWGQKDKDMPWVD